MSSKDNVRTPADATAKQTRSRMSPRGRASDRGERDPNRQGLALEALIQNLEDLLTIDSDYHRIRSRLESLETESLFIIERAVSQSPIKTHSITHRVKELESARTKLRRPASSSLKLADLRDLVGIRIVVLFLSDLPLLLETIRASFDVIEEDDKITASGSENAFGYMSHHLIVRLPQRARGPRYDDIGDIPFEIQVRTILMDAWANVSHYLDYKGDSSIPLPLRRDFYALSGLFFIADKHFELFFAQSQQSQQQAEQLVANESPSSIPLDLDTLQAMLRTRYPDREEATRSELSDAVEELTQHGFNTIDDVEQMLERHSATFLAEETALIESDEATYGGQGDIFFSDVGVLRISLRQDAGDER